MKRGLFIAIAVSLGLLALACSRQDGGDKKSSLDFRQTRWGMSQEEVKSSEKDSPRDERPEVIVYLGEYEEMEALIGYVFEKGKLVNGGYAFLDRPLDLDNYIRDYENLKKSLVSQYGKPYVDESVWNPGEKPEEDPKKFAEAVCSGRLRYMTVWETDTTLIKLTLERRRDHCQIALQFESLENIMFRQTNESSDPVEPPLP